MTGFTRIWSKFATSGPVRYLNMVKLCQKSPTSAIFGHIFAVFKCFTGHILVIVALILVQQVICFKISTQRSKSDKK